jgi:phage terminase large subunit
MEGIDIVFAEECQTISQASLDILIPTIRKPGSQLYYCWNPNYATDPIEHMFAREEKPPNTFFLQVNYDKNPWFPEVLRQQMEYDRARDIDKFNHVWLGQYVTNSEKRIYKNWKVEEFDTPKDAEFYFGLDLGFSVDPSVLTRCFIEGRKLYIDYAHYEMQVETVELPNFCLQVPESENYHITVDSARPESISHLKKHGFPKARASVKGPNSVVEGIEFLRGYNITIHPRCERLIEDFTFYSYKVDSLTGDVTSKIDHFSSDGPDSVRYGIEAVRRIAKNQKKIEFTPIPNQNRW